MTDRELLELAAKAAGYSYRWLQDGDRHLLRVCYEKEPKEGALFDSMDWNPLTDDGDALRLAIDTKIRIDPEFTYPPDEDGAVDRCIGAWLPWDTGNPSFGGFGKDKMETVRKLIVHAAAWIGKTTK